jgi:hypothetical protein
MTSLKTSSANFLNGRFTRMYVDTNVEPNYYLGSGSHTPTWTLIGGELTGKWTIDPQLEDYTTKDSDAIVYYPTRYKWNGSFDTNFLDDDLGQQLVRATALSVGQSAPLAFSSVTAPGPTLRLGWKIQEDITGNAPAGGTVGLAQSHMVGVAAVKIDYDMTDAKMGKMTVTFTGSGSIDIATNPSMA